MVCNKCGREIGNNNFCPWCDYNLNQVNQYNYYPNNPPKKKNNGCLIGCLVAFLGFIVFIALIIGLIFILTSKAKKNDEIKIEKDYQYLGQSKTGKYTIKDAKEDILFYVSPDIEYVVKDSAGKIVDTTIEQNAIKSKNGYEKGKTYTVSITKGNFVSEQLTDAKEVEFTIARSESKKYKYKDNVKNVKESDIKVNANKTVMISNNTYKVGDVLTISEGINIKEAYIVLAFSNGKYKIREAKLDEIYSELDFYYKEKVDLSDIKIQKEVEDYVASTIKSAPWFLYLVDEVEAKPKLEFDTEVTDNGLDVEAKISISAKEENKILKSINHDLSINVKYHLSMEQLIDITLTNWDARIDVTNSFELEFNYKNKFFSASDKKLEEQTKKWVKELNDAMDDKSLKDKEENDVDIAEITIPTPVPALSMELELGLYMKVNAFVNINAKSKFTSNIVVGFDYGIKEEFTPISSYTNKFSDSSINITGAIDAKLGFQIELKAKILNTLEAGVEATAGLYNKATLVIEAASDTKFNVTAKNEMGIFITLGLVVEVDLTVADYEKSFDLIDVKIPISSLSKTTKETLEYEEDEDTPKIVDSEKGLILNPNDYLLDKNSCVKIEDNNVIAQQSFDFKNGELSGGTYVLKVDVSNDIDWVENLTRFLCRIFSAYYMLEHRTLAIYTDEGNYAVITFHLNKANMLRELGLKEDSNTSYSYIKSYQTSKGFTCN